MRIERRASAAPVVERAVRVHESLQDRETIRRRCSLVCGGDELLERAQPPETHLAQLLSQDVQRSRDALPRSAREPPVHPPVPRAGDAGWEKLLHGLEQFLVGGAKVRSRVEESAVPQK